MVNYLIFINKGNIINGKSAQFLQLDSHISTQTRTRQKWHNLIVNFKNLILSDKIYTTFFKYYIILHIYFINIVLKNSQH